jgi:hypothetical protein
MMMNSHMSALLQKAAIQWPIVAEPIQQESLKLEVVHGCTVIKGEFDRNKHVKIAEFPDKTGFECFINHVHLPFAGTRESLISCLQYATALHKALAPFAQDRQFRIIVAISDDGCSVRFHEIRPGENWLSSGRI